MQEVKRPATAPTPKASEPVKTNVIKERPLSSGASDKKATQPTQTVHRQNVEKVVSQETRQNDTKDRRIKVQQTQTVQKSQQTTEKNCNLVTKKGQIYIVLRNMLGLCSCIIICLISYKNICIMIARYFL